MIFSSPVLAQAPEATVKTASEEPEAEKETPKETPRERRARKRRERLARKARKAKDAKAEKAEKAEAEEAAPPPPEEVSALLTLYINEMRRGEIQATLRDGDVLVPVAALEETSLPAFDGTREEIDGEKYVSLTSLEPGLTFILDERELTLHLSTTRVLRNHTEIDFRNPPTGEMSVGKDFSVFLNYNLRVNDFNRGSAFTEAGINWMGTLLYSGLSANTDGQVVRGMTNATVDFPEKMVRAIAGDSFSRGGPLSGSRVVGGLQVSRLFSLDPYFIRFPSPSLAGAVQTPSIVDVYIGERLVGSRQIEPGTFDLQNVPVMQGASATRLVLRDAFGREQEITEPYYFSGSNLKPGLHEYSYSLGLRRNRMGSHSLDYSDPGIQGFHR
ncbi:MAG: hypothetical protein KC416_04350, partial [Myxococcales bacterium]|nr:hypothetical protein [Myxococcales bacterium]